VTIGERIAASRKAQHLSQTQLAERMRVSFQAVSGWERDDYLPDTEKMIRLAECLKTSVGFLLGEKETSFPNGGTVRFFDVERMYTQVRAAANAKQLMQTARALSFASQMHKGQKRKGIEEVPYMIHPLMITCHALAMGLDDDELLAAALLHDVVEDCSVSPEQLPVSKTVQKIVSLLSFRIGMGESKEAAKQRYYSIIRENPLAAIIKVLDRCNNISSMANGFEKERMVEYIQETEQFVLPLLVDIKERYPQYYNAAFLIKYHMLSVLESLKRFL